MDITEAIGRRHSIRAFKPDTVPQKVLRELLALALRAPSWANTQPWKFVVVSGAKLDAIRRGFLQKEKQAINMEIPSPVAFPEPYDTRRRALAEQVFKTKEIGREDTGKRRLWRQQGLQLFGAPCAIYICVDRSFYFQGDTVNAWPLFDCGMVAQNIMLLATSYGLGTIPQIQPVSYPDVLRKVLGTPASDIFVLGIAIGYPDADDPINRLRSEREPLDRVSRWYGFEG